MNNYVPVDGLLNGRVIIVTGAGEGIGRCAAVEFARLGAEVILLGRTQRKLEGVYDEIVDSGYKEPVIHPMDLLTAKGRDYQDFAQRLKENLGRLDGVLHNAAELDILTPIQYYDEELWESAMKVNVTAPYLLTQACLPLLLASEDASIVFITDDCAREANMARSHSPSSRFPTTPRRNTGSVSIYRVPQHYAGSHPNDLNSPSGAAQNPDNRAPWQSASPSDV